MREALADEGLPVPHRDAAGGDAGMPAFDRGDLFARLKRVAEAVVRRRGGFLDTALARVAENASGFSRAQFARQAKAAMGVDLATIEPNLAPVMSTFRRANLELITSMARDKVERVKAILDDAPNARVETIRDRILEEGNVTRRQAALIARDQVLSLNAQATEKRHAAAGIDSYIWRTSGDGDVRPAHRALNGKRFKYSEPPVQNKQGDRANPGVWYQCRCTAEPVMDWGEEPTARTDAGDFKEGEHPRAKGGEFTAGGGGAMHAKPKKEGGPPQDKSTTPAPSRSPANPAPPQPREPIHTGVGEAAGEHRATMNKVLRGKLPLDALPSEVRTRMAEAHRRAADAVGGPMPKAAAAYNRHRADYLEGKTQEVPGPLLEFKLRHNLPDE